MNPEDSIYFNGGFLLKVLHQEGKVDVITLYQEVCDEKEMSYPLFVFCLDWLYLINAAVYKDGFVMLCK